MFRRQVRAVGCQNKTCIRQIAQHPGRELARSGLALPITRRHIDHQTPDALCAFCLDEQLHLLQLLRQILQMPRLIRIFRIGVLAERHKIALCHQPILECASYRLLLIHHSSSSPSPPKLRSPIWGDAAEGDRGASSTSSLSSSMIFNASSPSISSNLSVGTLSSLSRIFFPTMLPEPTSTFERGTWSPVISNIKRRSGF